MRHTRRQLLSALAGAAGIGALAGCTDGTNNATPPDGTTAEASFFVFGDLAGTVAGDAATAGTLVPIGQHGHGWEPGPSVREEIRAATLLFHGLEGFQPWVDSITADLAADGADTTAVDVSTEVDLLSASGQGHDEDTHETNESDHHDEEGDHHEEDDANQTEDEARHEEDEAEHQAEDSHDHGGTDPHFWMDPVRLQTAVGTIRDAFATADPDNSAAYESTAATLREGLADLDAEIEATVAAGSTKVLLVAGHDSFSYLADRYGIEVIALTGVGPDDQPSPRDIQRAQDAIETHGLDYICADPLESQQAAEQLVADTDAAEVLPLTAMPGLTDAWADNDWGYLDIMESVNLPTLERALDS